jgi:hypothetical protein
MKTLYHILLTWSLTGVALSAALYVGAGFGKTQVGPVTMGVPLAGLCMLWPFVVICIGNLCQWQGYWGNKEAWKNVTSRIPRWMGVAVYLVLALDLATGISQSIYRPGASNASLSDFRDPLAIQSWSVHAILMYGMAAVIFFAALQSVQTARNKPRTASGD